MNEGRKAARRLRLGIVGCANVAKQFARDVAASDAVELAGIASRTPATAAEFAKAHGIGRAFASYEALLASPEIDAVYLPLPNALHAPWAIRAAEAGKHVLCEKPLATTLADAVRMFGAAARHDVVLLESFTWYFQPQTAAMMELVRGDAIGEIRSMHACFGYGLAAPGANFGFSAARPEANIRLQPALGGGALLDAGSNPVSLIRMVMGAAPRRVQADASWAESGVDIDMSATLHYEGGRRAQMECSMDAANHRRAIVVGSRGSIETEYLPHTGPTVEANAFGYRLGQLRVRRTNRSPYEDVHAGTGSGFVFAVEAFAALVAKRDARVLAAATEASLDNAATLEALARSAKEGGAVDVVR